MPADARNKTGRTKWLVVAGLAIGLSYAFWRPLWHGGGLIGGDTYTYYLPQKAFYADRLQAGEIPLWNPLVGHGYPIVAESQTGVFYPTNLLLYRWLDVNTAYNASLLLHFVSAFVVTSMFARRMGLGFAASLLAALVFVYSWFPPRICLEWAIIGAVYFPLTLWCVESFLQSARARYLILLSGALGLHLLAGHFNLAFIEVLTCLAYAALRCWGRRTEAESAPPGGSRAVFAIALAVTAGFALAAVQLAPTWQLKQLSQRAGVGAAHDPGYGHIPPWYLTQVVAPWMWYAPDVNADQVLNSIKALSISSATNKIEAHLYFGLLPLSLAVGGLLHRSRSGDGTPARLRIWGWLGLGAVVYATGWLLPATRYLPGFNFFIGPGRYGIITTMAVALLSSWTLDRWLRNRRRMSAWLVCGLVLGITAVDLWFVRIHWNRTTTGAPNWYADLIEEPPIKARQQSIIAKVLSEYPAPVRMYGSFQNAPTLTGFAMTPPYLGLGPAEYYDPALTMPRPAGKLPTPEEIDEQVAWLRQAGVTHVLSEQPLSDPWPVELVWEGHDPLLSPAAARRDPYYLYELRGTRGRISTLVPAGGRRRIVEFHPQRIVLQLDSQIGNTLVQTDLLYPGWDVSIDGTDVDPVRIDGMYRGVEVPAGHHTVVWTYSPATVWWGGLISLVAAAGLVLCGVIARLRPDRIPS